MPLQLRRDFALDSQPRKLLSVDGNHMRIPSDIRKTVVFIGHMETGSPFEPVGTAFFFAHQRMLYLVTARHIAEEIAEEPFHFRLTHENGSPIVAYCDPLTLPNKNVRWFFHDDPTVDVAALPFGFDWARMGADFEILEATKAIDRNKDGDRVETGDFCYVVGLFSLHAGKGRNMPVIHTGHIAMMPDPTEKIPTEDWRNRSAEIDIEGYLVEISNLQGLSGSPVLVRPTVRLNLTNKGEETAAVIGGSAHFYLLGVWQGSWEGRSTMPGPRNEKRVPVGMGIVTPVEKLIELLNAPAAAENRRYWCKETNAKPDGPVA